MLSCCRGKWADVPLFCLSLTGGVKEWRAEATEDSIALSATADAPSCSEVALSPDTASHGPHVSSHPVTSQSPHSSNEITSSSSSITSSRKNKKSSDDCVEEENSDGVVKSEIVNINHSGDENTAKIIAETLSKLKNSSTSLTIVNISTSHTPTPSGSKADAKKVPPNGSARKQKGPANSLCKPELEGNDLEHAREFNFAPCDNFDKSSPMMNVGSNNMSNIDSKDFLASLISSCANGANSGNGEFDPSSGFDLGQTAAMMMMLNNNNTSVTPAPGNMFGHFNRRHTPSNHQYHSNQYNGFGMNNGSSNLTNNSSVPNSLSQGSPCDANSPKFNNNNSNSIAGPGMMPFNMNNISLPSLLAPLGPHAPSFFLSPHSWHQQFRCMSPNMLMAIEAVRAGKMGFTQAGRTFGVNGRTLWVYYRRLGYKVHNTFRGRRNKDATSNSGGVGNMMPQVGNFPPHIASNSMANISPSKMANNFPNNNFNAFPGNFNNMANNNYHSGPSNFGPNFFGRGIASGSKLPMEPLNSGFQNFHTKFFENSNMNDSCANNSSNSSNGNINSASAASSNQSDMSACLVGNASNIYNNSTPSANASGANDGSVTANTDSSANNEVPPVPSPSSLIGPLFGAGSSYAQHQGDTTHPFISGDTNNAASAPPPEGVLSAAEGNASGPPSSVESVQCSQPPQTFGLHHQNSSQFPPVFFSNGFGFGGDGSGGSLLSPSVDSNMAGSSVTPTSMVKQEGTPSQRHLPDSRDAEENNTSLEALLEACTNRNVWQHNAM